MDTWVLSISEMRLNPSSRNGLQKLDFCLFLVPITSPERISSVGSLSHVKSFPFRLWISLLPLRRVQKKFPGDPTLTFHGVPVTYHCHEWKPVAYAWSVENLPVPPESVISEEPSLGLIFISTEQVQADSNTRSTELRAISGESKVAEERRAKSHLLMSNVNKQRSTCF